MVHGDDNGLVLPPQVAPIQVVIVPVRQQAEGVLEKCREIAAKLKAKGVRVKIDESEHTPGWKFAEWEMKGVPLRLELGPRDLEQGLVALAKRYNGEKLVGKIEEVEEEIPNLLSAIQEEMYQKALAFLQTKIVDVENLDEPQSRARKRRLRPHGLLRIGGMRRRNQGLHERRHRPLHLQGKRPRRHPLPRLRKRSDDGRLFRQSVLRSSLSFAPRFPEGLFSWKDAEESKFARRKQIVCRWK